MPKLSKYDLAAGLAAVSRSLEDIRAQAGLNMGVRPRDLGNFELRGLGAGSEGGAGAELVPKALIAALAERVELAAVISALFPAVEMKSNPFLVPGVSVSRLPGSVTPEGETVAQITTLLQQTSLEAKPFGARIVSSLQLIEDSAISIPGYVETEVGDYLAHSFDEAIVNGNAGDVDVTDPKDPRLAFDGLRVLCPDETKQDAENGPLTAALLRAARMSMGVYGVRSDQVCHVVGVASYAQLLADQAFVTIDRYGPAVQPLPGEYGRVDGVPVVPSEAIRQDLNAEGVYDGETDDRTLALTVNRRSFVVGERPAGSGESNLSSGRSLAGQDVAVQREEFYEKLVNGWFGKQDALEAAVVVVLWRDFAGLFPPSEPALALTYNLKTT